MRIYKGDIGTKIQLDAGEALAGASEVQLKYKKPDGVEGYFPGTVDGNHAYYVTTDVSDLNVAGKWELQLYVSDLSGWTGYGEINSFYVEEQLQSIDIGRGYCNVDDVQRLAKRVDFSTSSKVSKEDVKDYVEDRYHEINSRLASSGVTVPISVAATVSYRLLRRLNALGAAGDCENTPTLVATGKASELGKVYLERYNKILDSYVINPKLLYDAKQEENRLSSSTEGLDSSKIPFPMEKGEEFIQDHGQSFGGNYSVDSGVSYFRGP